MTKINSTRALHDKLLTLQGNLLYKTIFIALLDKNKGISPKI